MTTETATGYYHYLTLRRGEGVINKAIGSSAKTIDDACHERGKIAAQYHPNEIVALTTHNCGVGPGCR